LFLEKYFCLFHISDGSNVVMLESVTIEICFIDGFLFSDEVDVIGYTSNQSDTDDHSSVQSTSSDSGVAMSTSRLTLSEMEII
jgi:MAX dimerization protein